MSDLIIYHTPGCVVFSLSLSRGYKYECLYVNTLNKHINICVCVLMYPYLGVFGYVTVPTIHLRPTPWYCPCPFVYEICYSGLPSSVFLTFNTTPRYQPRFVSGQDIQFWLDMKDNWIDPMKHQNVESSDQQVNVSSTDNVVSTTRVDQTSDDEDWLL